MGDLPILFVAGLGRCGTTMVMTMLDAGGFPVAGPRPSYEPGERWVSGRPDLNWLAGQGGCAVKWIDPTRNFTLPGRLNKRPVIILLSRRPSEQAKSQIKLLQTSANFDIGRNAQKAMERSIRRDSPVMHAKLSASATVHPFDFEDVLKNPTSAARNLQRLVEFHFGTSIDSTAAANVVISRHPSCAPGMEMETMILPLIAAEIEASR